MAGQVETVLLMLHGAVRDEKWQPVCPSKGEMLVLDWELEGEGPLIFLVVHTSHTASVTWS